MKYFIGQQNNIRMEYKGFYRTVSGNAQHCAYKTRLDPYGCGCAHNCGYCYSRSMLAHRHHWDIHNPRVADMEKVQAVVNTKIRPGTCIRVGGTTDPFQSIERKEHNTYRLIQMFNRRRVHYMLITKSDLIATDEYIAIMDKELAHIQISITTTDDALARQYEHCTPPSRRIIAIEKLQQQGFDVSLRLSPFVPQLVDYDAVNAIKCDKCLVGFMFVSQNMRRWFDIDYSQFTHYEGFYHHLPLATKIEALSHITGFKELSVCEDCPSHYPYWRDHVNPNKQDCCNLHIRPLEPQQLELW